MSIGYPDYSRTQAEAGNQLGTYNGQKQNDPTTGIIDCVGYAYLTINVNDFGNINHFTMIITWYSDHGGVVIVNTSQFAPVPGSNVPYQVPVVSRYVQVLAQHQVFGDTEVVSGVVFGSNVVTPSAIVGPKVGPFIYSSHALGAGGNQSDSAPYTYWGPATLYGSTSSGFAFVVQLSYFDMNTASFKVIASLNGTSSNIGFAVRVSLPPNPVELTVINTDSVARTVIGSLCIG